MMKKLIILLLFTTISSCNEWKKDKNGNEFYVKRVCMQSHLIPVYGYIYIGKILVPNTTYICICDAYRLDTIWKNK